MRCRLARALRRVSFFVRDGFCFGLIVEVSFWLFVGVMCGVFVKVS
jgi:hypothetical protein